MKKFSALIILALFCLMAAAPSLSAQTTSPRSADACESCHADFSSVLPKEHQAVKEKGLSACLQCHSIGQAGEAKKNGFSTRIHLTHAGQKLHMECGAAHNMRPEEFRPYWTKQFLGGRRKTATWPQSSRSSPPGQTPAIPTICTPRLWLTVRDATAKRCLYRAPPSRIAAAWFAMVLEEQLAAKSAPKDFPERNPHRSHLDQIPCALCHHAHAEATVYCLDYHRNFNMTIPGAGQ